MNETQCAYCEARPQRLALADALDSGRYKQLPMPDRLTGLLQGENGYSLTGVATAELTGSLWVLEDGLWNTYPHDLVMHSLPDLTPVPHEIHHLESKTLERLQQMAGCGQSLGCPEETACALGIHEDREGHEHPAQLEVHTSMLSKEQKKDHGIKPVKPERYIPLDILDFAPAANLLRQDRFMSHHCTGEENDEQRG